MSIFSRLFGKKEDDLGLDKPAEGELHLEEPLPQDDLALEEKAPFSTPIPETAFPSHSPRDLPPHLAEPAAPSSFRQPVLPGTPQRDLELINSKLDTIKAMLNSLDQRTANLEQAAGVEQKRRMPW